MSDLFYRIYRRPPVPSNRIWNNTTLCSPKQQIWLRTALCGGWCRRMALRNIRVACQKRRRRNRSMLKCITTEVKVKVWTIAIAPLTWVWLVTSSALQFRKWQLIGMNQWCRSALCDHPLPMLMDNWTHCAASRHTIAPISHTRPSPHSQSEI